MQDRLAAVTVRVKMVNLDHLRHPNQVAIPQTQVAQTSAVVGMTGDHSVVPRHLPGISNPEFDTKAAEICLRTGHAIDHRDFEDHIEVCEICSNRVELQLDFIETLESSLYQRKAAGESTKLSGALLVSTPELNFAICGELET